MWQKQEFSQASNKKMWFTFSYVALMVFLFLQAMTKEMFLEFLVATKISWQKRREKHLEVNMLLAIINAERIVTKNLVLSLAAVRVFTSICLIVGISFYRPWMQRLMSNCW